MVAARRWVLGVAILASLLLLCATANATVEVTTGFVSERRSTFISLQHEDASPLSQLVAELAQSANTLDHAFHRMRLGGQLLPAYATLVIRISDDAYQKLLPAGAKAGGYAVLSLVNDYRLDLDPHDVITADDMVLGQSYSIELAIWPVSMDELLTLVLLLPRLNAETPRLELMAKDIERQQDAFATEIESSAQQLSSYDNDLLWSPDGNSLLTAAWHNRKLTYHVFDIVTKERKSLQPLSHYILPPTFSPNSRFIAYASQTELIIVDLKQQQTKSFSLQKMAPDTYQSISLVKFAGNQAGDTLFFSLFGWGMPSPFTFLWRSAQPEQTETVSRLEPFTKPDLPGETWSDWVHRRHPSVVRTPSEFVALKQELATTVNLDVRPVREQLQARYGIVHGIRSINYPQDSRLVVLIENAGLLGIRVLELPTLREISLYRPERVPRLQVTMPGQIADISLFNLVVATIILMMSLAMTAVVTFITRKAARRVGAPTNRRQKYIFFTGALLITLLLHFVATVGLLYFMGDTMGQAAYNMAYQFVAEKYARFGYTIEPAVDTTPMWGSSSLGYIDFPYQVLYWRLSGFTQFAAPVGAGLPYAVYNRQGHFVEHREAHYYVLGVNLLFRRN